MRTTKAIVRLGAITQNLDAATRCAPGSKILAVIKANAYGHGAVEVARLLQSSNPARVPAFAVAFFDEAVQLRDAGISRPILILQGTTAAADVAEAAAKDFWLMLHDRQQVDRVLQSATALPVRVWIKADTGMHRLGLDVTELDNVFAALSAAANVQQDMILCTHLACAEDQENPLTRQQVNQIRPYAAKYKLPLSIANSAAIMCWPESHADWNRPGYMLYGNHPLGLSGNDSEGLFPAMTMTSRILAIREVSPGEGIGYGHRWVAKKQSKIGTIPIGYADGYPRHAASGTPVLVNGQRVPLAGRVSMDMISVDLSGHENVKIGDPVELWGEQLSVDEVAACAGTIGYEILAGLTGHVPITYLP
ncbi:MAG: alanine racemase [Gammaproteobacteria bacterium]|nr:MAG: alanine racemase [Gammaproteobacteria bacterium]